MTEQAPIPHPEMIRPLSITLATRPAQEAVREAITTYLPQGVLTERRSPYNEVPREENNALRTILTGLSNSLELPLDQFDMQSFGYSTPNTTTAETTDARIEQHGESVTLDLPTLSSQTGLQAAVETELHRITRME